MLDVGTGHRRDRARARRRGAGRARRRRSTPPRTRSRWRARTPRAPGSTSSCSFRTCSRDAAAGPVRPRRLEPAVRPRRRARRARARGSRLGAARGAARPRVRRRRSRALHATSSRPGGAARARDPRASAPRRPARYWKTSATALGSTSISRAGIGLSRESRHEAIRSARRTGARSPIAARASGPLLVCHPGGPGFSSRYLADLGGLGDDAHARDARPSRHRRAPTRRRTRARTRRATTSRTSRSCASTSASSSSTCSATRTAASSRWRTEPRIRSARAG